MPTQENTGKAVEKNSGSEESKPNENAKREAKKENLSIKDFLRSSKNMRIIKHILLILGFVILSLIINLSFITFAKSLSQGWIANLRPGNLTESNTSPPAVRDMDFVIKIEESEKKRIKEQLNDIRIKEKHHFDVTHTVYSNFYMGVMTFSVFAAMAAIFLVMITRKGLDGVNEYILTMFLVTTSIAIFYQAFPGLFQQKKTVDDNKALYIKYTNLEDEIVSYATTGGVTVIQSSPTVARTIQGETPTNTNSNSSPQPTTIGNQYSIIKLTPSDFIHYMDYQLKVTNDIAIGFDESKAASFAKEQFNLR